MSYISKGSTNAIFFKDFINKLLHYYGKWLEPKSVIIIDNTSFHHSENIKAMYSIARVKLVYLPPYSPDLNPIEECFSELKAFVRRHWQSYEDDPDQGFDNFLEWCIQKVGWKRAKFKRTFSKRGN